jgi:hypothetical protein
VPKLKVTMFGLTTEGYRMAADLAEKAEVTIVDETLQMALELTPALLKKNPDLGELMSGEPLLSFRPLEKVLGGADVVFFTPKLRRPAEEALIEAGTKLREVAKYLAKGVTFANSLPTGPGGNSENIMLIEKQTGLKVGETLNYAYLPLKPGEARPTVASSTGLGEGRPLEGLGFGMTAQNVFSAELEYAAKVISEAIRSVTQIEMARRAREAHVSLQDAEELYVDSFARSIYDLRAIQAGEGTGESIAYLAGAAVKSLENYVRYVVDEARDVLKEKELKASRTKVTLLWNLDRYEMRADRIQMAEGIQVRLRDYVTDVGVVDSSRLAVSGEVLDPLKHNVVIACSQAAYDSLKKARGRRNIDATVVKATSSLKRE